MRLLSKSGAGWLWLLMGALVVCSCAPSTTHYAQVNQFMQQDQYADALNLMNQNQDAYADRKAALYNMEVGVLAHYANRYSESNQSLARAEAIVDELYTRSISKHAASFIINDNTIPYRGEDFEDAMLNLFMAMNYVGMRQWEDALVEARIVDNKLNLINSRYEDDQRNTYTEDAFIRFMMGVLYETEGEINDAFISYRKAEEIYRSAYQPNYGVEAPVFLIENLYYTARALDFREELDEIRELYPQIVSDVNIDKDKMAELYCIHYNGQGPEKIEENWVAPMPDGYVLKVAYPKFQQRYYGITTGRIELQNKTTGELLSGRTELMEDIDSIARKNLRNRLLRIKAKAIARATSKYLATKAGSNYVEQQNGDYAAAAALLVKLAGNIASAMTEQADTRHWRLLPAQIRVSRILISPGLYSGQVAFVNNNGTPVLSRNIRTFQIEDGQKHFITYRTLD